MNHATNSPSVAYEYEYALPRDRDHRREFGIAEAGERAAEAGDQEREDERRARVVRGRRAGQHEDAGADDGADAEQHQRPGIERPVQFVACPAASCSSPMGWSTEQSVRHWAGLLADPGGQCRRTLPERPSAG